MQYLINRNMRCIEMRVTCKYRLHHVSINRNMRCIEMICCHLHICHRLWLIETWDVLKYGWKHQIFIIVVKINRNMRCIEMRIGRRGSCGSCVWLIETWDVLKCFSVQLNRFSGYGLIETWDVLKSDPTHH